MCRSLHRPLQRFVLLACCYAMLHVLMWYERERDAGARMEKQEQVELGKEKQGETWVTNTQLHPITQLRQAAQISPDSLLKESRTGAAPPPPQHFPLPVIPLQHWSDFPSQVKEDKHTLHLTVNPRVLSEVFPLWMRVTDDIYTYSAFWDSRFSLPKGPMVRVLGILKYPQKLVKENTEYHWNPEVKGNVLNCSCFLWFPGQQYPEEGELNAFIFEEGLKVFVGTYFLCSPQQPSGNSSRARPSEMMAPYAVSLLPHRALNSSHKLIYLSHSTGTVQDGEGSSGACVRPLFGPYTDLATLTQFIAYYNAALNVSHFYFYDLAISNEVKAFLKLLATDHSVRIHVLPWNTPTSNWEELWDLGSLTALNDCVYRASGQHSHLAIVDLDEFIVPRAPAATLGGVYTNVLKHKHGTNGDAVLILNAFFCSEFQKDSGASGEQEGFKMFTAKRREARLWPAKSRSKMVVIPRAVVAVGHHMVNHFLHPDSKNQASPKLAAVLHHYRNCQGLRLGMHGMGPTVLTQETVRDGAIMRYRRSVLTSSIVNHYLHFISNTI